MSFIIYNAPDSCLFGALPFFALRWKRLPRFAYNEWMVLG